MKVIVYALGKKPDIFANARLQFRARDGIDQCLGIRSGHDDGMLTDVIPVHEPVPTCSYHMEWFTRVDDTHLARSLLECPKSAPTEIGDLDSVVPLFASGRQCGVHLPQPCIVCGDKLTCRNHEKVKVAHSRIVTVRSDGSEDVDANKILAQKPNQTGMNVGQKVTDVGVRCDRHSCLLAALPGPARAFSAGERSTTGAERVTDRWPPANDAEMP